MNNLLVIPTADIEIVDSEIVPGSQGRERIGLAREFMGRHTPGDYSVIILGGNICYGSETAPIIYYHYFFALAARAKDMRLVDTLYENTVTIDKSCSTVEDIRALVEQIPNRPQRLAVVSRESHLERISRMLKPYGWKITESIVSYEETSLVERCMDELMLLYTIADPQWCWPFGRWLVAQQKKRLTAEASKY